MNIMKFNSQFPEKKFCIVHLKDPGTNHLIDTILKALQEYYKTNK